MVSGQDRCSIPVGGIGSTYAFLGVVCLGIGCARCAGCAGCAGCGALGLPGAPGALYAPGALGALNWLSVREDVNAGASEHSVM